MDILAATNWWQRLQDWDQRFFVTLNSRLTNPLFDAVLPWLRDAYFWTPLYLFTIVFIPVNYGRRGLWWVLGFVCTVALTDIIGTRVFKDSVERLRPCQDPLFADQVRLLLKHCSGSYSFVSNHAANHFALATFTFLTLRKTLGNWLALTFLWAFIIAYAQVYVGVHYPLDVICGAMLGLLAGTFMAWIFNTKMELI